MLLNITLTVTQVTRRLRKNLNKQLKPMMCFEILTNVLVTINLVPML